jgi:DNA adenine methylase
VVPFLKWAGGKRWLASSFRHLFPQIPGRHIEPFAGSAAMFFALQPEKAIIADMNGKLIETYVAIRDEVDEFQRYFESFARHHSKELYYQTRKQRFRSPAKRAAQFVYLNRVCFNGIYRENLKGEFNVPLGSKTSAILDSDNFEAVSALLQCAEFLTSDFENVVNRAEEGDLLYVDPPYTTKHNFNGFVKYNQNIFSWEDQERLALAIKRAHHRGANIIVSNADHADVRALYADLFSVRSVTRMNIIASKSQYRRETTEMVATNAF